MPKSKHHSTKPPASRKAGRTTVAAKRTSAKLPPKLSTTEEDLLSHMRHGYQLETSSLGDNPVLHRLKDDTYLRADANRRTVETLQNRRWVGVPKAGKFLDPRSAVPAD